MRRFIERFEDVCAQIGDRMLIEDGEEELSYAQADDESARVYRYLKEQGIGRETFVHVFLPRKVHFISCVIGVWKAGAAFLLTDDTYPADRVAFMREDVGCVLVIDQALFDRIVAGYEPLGGFEPTDPHDAAYAVYTSGSTGTPKGVLHEYGNVDQCAQFVPDHNDLAEYRYGFVPPLHFVAGVMTVIQRTMLGSSLYLVSGALLRDYERFIRFIEEKQLDGIYLPPSYLRIYRHPAACLKDAATGSEPANGLYYEGGVPRIVNTYGMSEAGFFVLRKVLDHAYDVAPVGKPCMPIRMGLLGEDGQEVEGAGEGELFFENEYVRGYINRPDLTAQAFRDGIYYTGDICRRDESGDYYVVGRNDDMIKINGNRVEPAEIEAAIKRLTGLTQVVAKGFDEAGRSFICAYFLRNEAEAAGLLTDGELAIDTEALKQILPAYMIPTYYVGLEAFPINTNGKLVRKELAAPETAPMSREYVEPQNDTEAYIATKMAEVLGLERVGVTEDFYQLGGDSLACIKLVSLCDELSLSAADVYELRTPRAIAAHCASMSKTDADAAEREAESMELPLLLTQEQHIDLQRCAPDSRFLNMIRLWRIKDDVDLDRLARAVDQTIAAHPALCTRYMEGPDGTVTQRYDASLFAPCERVKVSEEEFHATIGQINRSFDLIDGRLYDCAIYQTERAAYLLFNVHHAIADGSSMHLILDEFFERYEDEAYQAAPDRYFSIVRDLVDARQTERYAEVSSHYDELCARERLAECPRWLAKDHESELRENGVIMDLEAFERRQGLTPTLFMTAVLVALARVDGTGQAMVSSVYATRDNRDRMAAAGILLTPVVVFARVDEDTDPAALVASVEEQHRYGSAHPECPLASRIEKSFDITRFMYQKDMVMSGSKVDDLFEKAYPVEVIDRMTGTLSVAIVDNTGSDRIGLAVRYDSGCYEAEHIERFVKLLRESVTWLEGV